MLVHDVNVHGAVDERGLDLGVAVVAHAAENRMALRAGAAAEPAGATADRRGRISKRGRGLLLLLLLLLRNDGRRGRPWRK